MLSYINSKTGAQYVCVSTDEKQTDVPNGSILFEMDTGEFYLFNKETLTWELQAISGGGGGGGEGTVLHNRLTEASRSLPNQHPIKSITGLQDELDKKVNTPVATGSAGQVLTNDGAGGTEWADSKGSETAVLYTPQELTAEQQLQAKENIGAGDYVTPEMFGAVGDGVADDSNAIRQALNAGKPVKFGQKTYAMSKGVTGTAQIINGNNTKIVTLNDISDFWLFRLTKCKKLCGLSFDFDGKSAQVVVRLDAEYVEIADCTVINIKNNDPKQETVGFDCPGNKYVYAHDLRFENLLQRGNGKIGDPVGSCTGLSIRDYTTGCNIENIIVKNIHNIDGAGKIILEDAVGVYVITREVKTETRITNINGDDYGKRLLKIDVPTYVTVSDVRAVNVESDMVAAISVLHPDCEIKIVNSYIENNATYDASVASGSKLVGIASASHSCTIIGCTIQSNSYLAITATGNLTVIGCKIYGLGVVCSVPDGNTDQDRRVSVITDTVFRGGRAFTAYSDLCDIELNNCAVVGEPVNGESGLSSIPNGTVKIANTHFENYGLASSASSDLHIRDCRFDFYKGSPSVNTAIYCSAKNLLIDGMQVVGHGYNGDPLIGVRPAAGSSCKIDHLAGVDNTFDVFATDSDVELGQDVNLSKCLLNKAKTIKNIPSYVDVLPNKAYGIDGLLCLLKTDGKLYKISGGEWSIVGA